MISSLDYPSAVSIVITHYRSPDDLSRCLSSLAQLPRADELDVVVVDSDADDVTEDLVREKFGGARYIPFTFNCGYAALVNAGLSATARPYVLIVNADIEVGPATIPALLDHFEQHPDVGIVGPSITFSTGQPQTTAFAFYRLSTILYRRTPLGRTKRGRAELSRFELRGPARRAHSTGQAIDVDWLMGAAVLVRRSAVLDVGPLDERYFLYFEDVDWCLQFWRSGWRVVYLPTAPCAHRWSRASKGGIVAMIKNPLTRRHVRSSVRFFRRNGVNCARPATVAHSSATPWTAMAPAGRADAIHAEGSRSASVA